MIWAELKNLNWVSHPTLLMSQRKMTTLESRVLEQHTLEAKAKCGYGEKIANLALEFGSGILIQIKLPLSLLMFSSEM